MAGGERFSHLAEVLRHYRTLSRPGYAVLVTGPWGSGKTHQVKACVREGERLYVSLFGLATAEAVHAAVLAAAFPDAKTAAKAMRAVGDVGKGTSLGAMASLVSGFGAAVLRQRLEPDRVLVFDDLERCALDLATLLGVINGYLEHKGFHVVLIADVTEFQGEDEGRFKRFREKLVGHSIEVEPQTGEAFDAFLTRIEDEALRDRVAQHRGVISQAFERAGASSLRVLRTLIDDVARLLAILAPRHAERPAAVDALVRLLAALAAEVELGKLSQENLEKRVLSNSAVWAEVRSMRKGEVNPLDEANKRHRGIELRDPLLPNALAIDMIVHGRFDADALAEALDRDARFVEPEEAPAWRVVWLNEETDDVVEQAVRTLLEQLARRAFVILGEMLQVFCLRVRLARLGYNEAGEDAEAAAQENIRYIDDLYAARRLPSPPNTIFEEFDTDGGYGGLGYAISGDEEKALFDRVWKHLKEKIEQARRDRFPERARELAELAASDPVAFHDAVQQGHGGSPETAEHPVLAAIKPQAFVDAWLSGPKPGWRYVARGLEGRYSGDRTCLWDAERDWIQAVIRILRQRANDVGRLPGDVIRRVIPRALEDRLRSSDGDVAEEDGDPHGA